MMVVAYLRGLLKPTHNFSLRSVITESVILDAIGAELAADAYFEEAANAASAITAIKHESRGDVYEGIHAKMLRARELKHNDIYRIGRALSDQGAVTLSSYQMFQIMSSNGMMEKLREQGMKAIENMQKSTS